MSKKAPSFKAPKVSNPPDLVVIEWIDAQSEHEHDGPSSEAGGLVRLPAVGYHVRTGRDENGRFIVLAREFSVIEGVLHSRDHFSVWLDKIVSWKVAVSLEPRWPVTQDSPTSTSSTKDPLSKPMAPAATSEASPLPTN
jgi:hypothetical protein